MPRIAAFVLALSLCTGAWAQPQPSNAEAPRGNLPLGGSSRGCDDAARYCQREPEAHWLSAEENAKRRSIIARSCAALARCFLVGVGRPKDYPSAARWADRACQLGHIGACGTMGMMLWHGWGMDVDRPLAVRMMTDACDARWTGSCETLVRTLADSPLARPYLLGRGFSRVATHLARECRKPCPSASPAGAPAPRCGHASRCYHEGLLRVAAIGKRPGARLLTARRAFEDACARGHRGGCSMAADFLLVEREAAPSGGGEKAQMPALGKLMAARTACYEKLAAKCAELAEQHARAGTAANDAEAARLRARSCALGHAPACAPAQGSAPREQPEPAQP